MIRLFLLSPQVLFQARVNMPSVTYPVTQITYDTITTGGYAFIFPGMTLLLGTTAGGDQLGRQRVRKVATSTIIPVGRSSQGSHDGELDIVDNAYITVLSDFRIWAKLPYIDPTTGESYKDWDINGAQAAYPHPKANGGIGYAGTINSGTGYATVQFDGGECFQFDPSVSSNLSGVTDLLWGVGDGTITVGTEESVEITATFPPGFHWVHLTAVGDNGRLHQMHIPVFVRDPDNDESISAFQITNHHIGRYGQEIDVKILADIPRSTYPDGTLAMIWEDTLEESSPFRGHMLFIGWHQSDDAGVSSQRTGTLRDTTLHLVDVAGRLKSLPGFPQVLEASASTDTWTETIYPNLFFYLHYLLYYHSTAYDLADLILGSQVMNNFAFRSVGSDADTLFNQANHLANSVAPDHHLTCNRRGQLLLQIDPMLMHTADRPGTVYMIISGAPSGPAWTEIRYSYERPPRVNRLYREAVLASATTIDAIACVAPGDARGQGSEDMQAPDGLVSSQFTLNYVEGHRYARLNAPYSPFTVRTPYTMLPNGLTPAYMGGWTTLTVAAAHDPQRGLGFSNQRCQLVDITVQYEYQRTGLARMATLTLEVETSGPPAQTVVLEEEEEAVVL